MLIARVAAHSHSAAATRVFILSPLVHRGIAPPAPPLVSSPSSAFRPSTKPSIPSKFSLLYRRRDVLSLFRPPTPALLVIHIYKDENTIVCSRASQPVSSPSHAIFSVMLARVCTVSPTLFHRFSPRLALSHLLSPFETRRWTVARRMRSCTSVTWSSCQLIVYSYIIMPPCSVYYTWYVSVCTFV